MLRRITKQDLKLARSLKRIRKSKGYTQEILAERLNISTGYLSKIETGVRIPNMKLLQKIAKILHIKVKDLIPF